MEKCKTEMNRKIPEGMTALKLCEQAPTEELKNECNARREEAGGRGLEARDAVIHYMCEFTMSTGQKE